MNTLHVTSEGKYLERQPDTLFGYPIVHVDSLPGVAPDAVIEIAPVTEPYYIIKRRPFLSRVRHAPKLWHSHFDVFVKHHSRWMAAYLATFFMWNFLRDGL